MAPRNAPKRRLIRRKQMARRRPTVLVNRALHPIPQRYLTKMKYAQVINTDAILGKYTMNLNSIFDPDNSGTGHQPYGFDTLATLYNRYRVISCGYRINIGVTGTTPPITLTAIPSNQDLTAGTGSELRENPRCKYLIQNPGSSSVYLSQKVSMPSLVGRTTAQYMADDRYQAQVNANPNEGAFLNIQTFNPITDLPLGPVSVQVIMEYTVEFFDVKSLGQS